MADFGFYRDMYLGRMIPESEFPALAARAQAYFLLFSHRFSLKGVLDQAQEYAVCAMAEVLFEGTDKGLTEKSVGNVRLRYERGVSPEARLLDALRPYFHVYRGVSRGETGA